MTPNASDVPARSGEAWALAGLVGLAGGLVGATYGGLIGPAVRSPPLSLEPYLDPAWINGVVNWAAPAFETPWFASVALGLAAGALVLLCDAVIRRALLASKPPAAALAAVLILLAGSWGGVLRIEGHWGILAGFLVAPVACLLVLSGSRAGAWSGAALAVLAVALHPAWLGVVVVALCAGAPRAGKGRVLAGVWTAALAVTVALAFARMRPVPMLAREDLFAFAARDWAAAPVLAFSPWRRLDLPTGYEPLTGALPVVAGLAAHALILGIGMMIGGVRRGLVAAGAGAVSVVGAALCATLPALGYVPGNRAFALPVVAAYAPLCALVFSAVPPRLARAAMPGLILGIGAIAVLAASDRAPRWTRIGPAMALAGERDFPNETDPARLVLYLHDITLRDADAKAVADAAERRLSSGAPALFPDRLDRILADLLGRRDLPRKTPAFTGLAREVADELAFAEGLWGQSPRVNFEPVAEALLQLQFKVLDLWFQWRPEPETPQLVHRFQRMVRDVAPVASKTGQFRYSIPLLQALQLIGPELPDTAATIAIQQVLTGEVEEGRAGLLAALAALPERGAFTALVRGVLGMTAFRLGDAATGLKEMQAAWSVIGAGGVRNVSRHFPADSVDYCLVAEILLARFEAAGAVDPTLAAQAARDLEELLRPLLSFGPRRVPALAIMGRLALLKGERDLALRHLREVRQIPFATLDDLADGPIGRIAHPRYRRFALENLLQALGDGSDTAAERDEVRAELAGIEDR